MYRKFALEGDVHEALDCVPLVVRRKLDLAARKISLVGWQALPRAERLALCHLPVETGEDVRVYREILEAFCERAGVPLAELASPLTDRRAWSAEGVPPALLARLDEIEPGLAARFPPIWPSLDEEERYALLKLTDPKRTTEKLRAALAELGLLGS